jgi:hypothetical protein
MEKKLAKSALRKMDLTPTPRLLQVLDYVAVEAWQCVAEIVDNSLDNLAQHDIKKGEVHIEYSVKTGVLQIQDNGSGMAFDDLEKALKAGYSTKSRTNELGLFGIGFNVACARLGNSATVSTRTKADKDWLRVKVDVNSMVEAGSYGVQPSREKLKTRFEHGTIVELELNNDNRANFERAQYRTKLSQQLGRTYSYLLRSSVPGIKGEAGGNPRDVTIYIDELPVTPWLPCIWDEKRSIEYRGSKVNSVKYFNRALPDAIVCHACGHWQNANKTSECENCGTNKLELSERKVWGWIGIQRNMDRLDFGISFLRNGREILQRDQGVFTFTDLTTGETFKDYPVEWPADLGRIVGEVHCDHVPVDFTKSSFKKEDPQWLGVIEIVRGNTSLQPKRAKSPNNSPLAEIFNAYRINEPGTRYLIPGNGTKAIHIATKNWAEKFHEGDPNFLTDEKWYNAALAHDNAKGKLVAPDALSPNPFISPISPIKGKTGSGIGKSPSPPKSETVNEKMERWKKGGYSREDLSKSVFVKSTNKSFDLKVWETVSPITTDKGITVCAIAVPVSGREFHGFVNSKHALVSKFGRDTTDIVLYEIASAVRSLEGSVATLTVIFSELLESFPDEERSEKVLRSKIEELAERLRSKFSSLAADNPDEFWSCLSDDMKAKAEDNKVADDQTIVWSDAINSGQYSQYLPLAAFVEITTSKPDLVFDSKFFKQHFATHHAKTARERTQGYLVRALSDLINIQNLRANLNNFEAKQADNALQFISDNLV